WKLALLVIVGGTIPSSHLARAHFQSLAPSGHWSKAADAPFTGNNTATVGSDGRIYAFDMGHTFAAYDTRTRAWSQLVIPGWIGISIIIAAGHKIYAFGTSFSTPDNPSTDNAYSYDLSKKVWVTITPSPGDHFGGAAVVGGDGNIYLMGGTNQE